MRAFHFALASYQDTLNQFANWPGNISFDQRCRPTNKNCEGFLPAIELQPGLFITVSHFAVKELTEITIDASPGDARFMISYVLNPASLQLIRPMNREPGKNNYILALSSAAHFSYRFLPGVDVKELSVHFSNEWLQRQFPQANGASLSDLLNERFDNMAAFIGPMSMQDNKDVEEVRKKVLENEMNPFSIKSKILSLLDAFIQGLSMQDAEDESQPGSEPIIKIERKLRSVIREKLPSLQSLAREFSMSESTLKRRFKQAFGMAPYEYYLKKKMELAAQILISEKTAISQLAFSLGYETPSPFIRMFKKYSGFSPRVYRERNRHQ